MSTTDKGREAEEVVAKELKKRGHKIIAMNWRRRRCEIDIVSQKKKTIYFTEVKYRTSSSWGSGFDYITPSKLKQMHFAAEVWVSENNWSGEIILCASEVDHNNNLEIVEIE